MRFSRRQLLKWGLVGSAGLVVPLATLQIPLAAIGDAENQASPASKPFVSPLPISPDLKPTHSDETGDYYEITQKEGTANILPGLTTPVWGYNGIFPGPTIEARSGRTTIIRQINELKVPVSTHLHGGHTPAESDGYPMDLIMPEEGPGSMPMRDMAMPSQALASFNNYKDYVYPNNQRASIHWLHDHRMDFTGPQIYKGLAAFYIIRDEFDDNLPLPKGERDIPLMITDRTFNADGTFFYPSLDPTLTKTPGVLGKFYNGMVGDTILVNGAIQPYLEVSNTRYRFRLLNASNSRLYRLALSTGQPFIQVGSDGGLLPSPAQLKTIRVSPAERFDVVIDFSQYPVGTQIVLQNLFGEGRTGEIMRFDVVRQAKDESSVPATLLPFESLEPATAVQKRNFQFFYGLAMWTINGKPFELQRTDATPRLGDTEIWEFTSDGNHPIHIHLVDFQVLSRNGGPPDPEDAGYKDTIFLKSGEKASVITRFTDYKGLYLFHCHNAEHEDMRMMGQFRVI